MSQAMKNRAYSVRSLQHHLCDSCGLKVSAVGNCVYLFPCGHCFHRHCLINEVVQTLDNHQSSAVRGIEELLTSIAANNNDTVSNANGTDNNININNRTQQQVESYQLELDGLIAADCPMCGHAMVESLGRSLIGGREEEAKTWQLM